LHDIVIRSKTTPRFDKPSTFTILNRTNYNLPECGLSKTEMTANLQKITEVVNIVRKNPVLSEIAKSSDFDHSWTG
jgi:hypothetical protein